ncbi:MAG: hypothetical protein GC199_10415 [Alphaproteobacteria bacterium]|nr:hypothetical protein [Alphaproteobacteria bacterium]
MSELSSADHPGPASRSHAGTAAGAGVAGVASFCAMTLFGWTLPWMGQALVMKEGAPASAWSIVLILLPAGWALANLYGLILTRMARLPRQGAVHLAVLAAALALLPTGILAQPLGTALDWPLADIALALAPAALLALLATAGTALLLQRWYPHQLATAATGPTPHAIAGGIGLLIGLLLDPLLLSPLAGLTREGDLWAIGLFALALLFLATLIPVLRAEFDASAGDAEDLRSLLPQTARVSASDRLRWVALSAGPAALLAITVHDAVTRLAPLALVWVMPVGLVLLVYLLAQSGRPAIRRGVLLNLEAVSLVGLAALVCLGNLGAVGLFCQMTLLSIVGFARFHDLADLAPDESKRLDFGLWTGIGALIGIGAVIANGPSPSMIAPQIAGLALVATAMARAIRPLESVFRFDANDYALPVLAAALSAMALTVNLDIAGLHAGLKAVLIAPFLLTALIFRERTLRFALALAALLGMNAALSAPVTMTSETRTAFGDYRVLADPATGARRLIADGDLRDIQWMAIGEAEAPDPGAVARLGDVLRLVRQEDRPERLALIGMGAGTITCAAQLEDHWTVFEPDPELVRIARAPENFTALRRCAPDARVVTGDPRLALTKASEGAFDIIVLDEPSAGVPAPRLYTKEAAALYFSKLADDGLLIVNAVTGALRLDGPLARLAAAENLTGLVQMERGALGQRWIILSRSEERLRPLIGGTGWRALPDAAGAPWSDDHVDLLNALR